MGEGGGRPDSEIRGAGGGGLKKNFFRPFGPQFGLKIMGERPPMAPPLDPPLLYTKWAVDHSPTPASQNVISLVRWHKQTSLRS